MGAMLNKLLILVSVFCLLGTAAFAAENDILADSNFSGTVFLTTDYVFRGISQTDSYGAVQGSMDYTHPCGVYLGVWGSNVNAALASGGLEIDYYLGYATELGGVGVDTRVAYYTYPGSKHPDPEIDFVEVHLGLSYELSEVALTPSLTAGYNYSPDFFGEDGHAHYVNGVLGLALPAKIGLAFEVGYQTVEGDKSTGNGGGLDGGNGYDWIHYRVGASTELKGFGLDLSYHDTNEEEFLGATVADDRLVFTISRSL